MKKQQRSHVNEIIENEIRIHKAQYTSKMAKTLQSGTKMHAGTFWEFKKKMDRNEKGETPSAMKNKNGEEKSTRKEIKNVFAEFYEDLFEKDQPTNEHEIKAENITNKIFTFIMKEAKNPSRKEPISKEMISQSIRKLKNKTSMDYDQLSNKVIKSAGQDFLDSLKIMFQEIDRENRGPEAWENMKIKSIYKGKNCRKEMTNRRGLFITSVISKLFEKTKLSTQRDIIEAKMSKFQTGGVQGKSTIDNKMVLNSVIDYNNLINSETYIFFADAHKCFDKLDLKTSIIDLHEMLGPHEAKLLYQLNKKANIVIQTPVGETDKIEVNEITKQGTLYGPILCDINTDKVNKVGTKNISTIGPNIKCEASIYVDDIEQAGSHVNIVERTAKNCVAMEDQRKFTFNNEVEKTAFMIVNPRKKHENIQQLETKVKRGVIKRTKEYKFLGEWYTEKDNREKSIATRESKSKGIAAQIKFYGDPYRVGNMSMQVKMQIYRSTAIQTIYHDIEAWSKITEKQTEKLEKIQKNVLTSILDLPTSTPYIGLLSEVGIWPVKYLIEYKRIMLLHQIITTQKRRFLKEIIEDQIKDTWEGCWMDQTKAICRKYELEIDDVRKLSKEQLKKTMKSRIDEQLDQLIKRESKEKTKLRFCSDFKQKLYTINGQIGHKTVQNILKLRLNMFELKCNYRGICKNDTCGLCKKEKDTTEHLFECRKIKKKIEVPKIQHINDINDENVYHQLGQFLDEVCKLKEIDSKKTIRENLQKPQDKYKSKNISKNGEIKLLIKIPRIRYRVKNTKGLKVTLQRKR